MPNAPTALMLFAAGLGTRMGELTRQRPKPLIKVAGKALLDHALDLAKGAGAAPVVVNTHYLAPQIVAHLHGTCARISDETGALLETGGGLRKALPLLGPGPVMTLNTDAVWTGPNVLASLRKAWDPAQMSALLALVLRSRALGYTRSGDFSLLPDGRLERGGSYVYTGAQILDPAGIEAISAPAFSLNLLWDRLLAEGRVYGLVHPGGWCDVGQPQSIALAEEMLAHDQG